MFIAVLVLAGDVDAGLNSALVFSSVHPELLWGTARVSWDWETQSENRPLGFSFPSTCNQIFRSLRNWQGKSRLLEDLSEEQTNLLGYTCFYFHMDTEVQVITSKSNNCHIHENKSENARVQIDIKLKKNKVRMLKRLSTALMTVLWWCQNTPNETWSFLPVSSSNTAAEAGSLWGICKLNRQDWWRKL